MEISESTALKMMREQIKLKYKTSLAYADAMGFTPQYVSAILLGHKKPSQDMLDLIGAKREKRIIYQVPDKHPATCEHCEYDFETELGDTICPLCKAKNKVNENYEGDL